MLPEACVMSETFMIMQQVLGEVRDRCLWHSCPAAWLRLCWKHVAATDKVAIAQLLV